MLEKSDRFNAELEIRESLDDENTRELIYKGYTVPFFINKEKNKIIILGIFNQNLWQ